MTFLPVVERELRVASRRRWTYFQRTLAAMIGMVGLAFTAFTLQRLGSSAFGTSLFIWLSVILFLTAGFGGIYAASDALSAERRENTLGLLFLTELSSLDVVLGKLVSSSLGVIYSLIALIPVLTIPLMAGGVEWFDVLRTVITTLNLLFLGLCLGLVGSVLYQNALSSLAMGIGLILICGFGAMIVAIVLDEWFGVRTSESWFVLTIFCACYYSFPSTLNGVDDQQRYWSCHAIFHVVAWAALAFSCRWIAQSWRDLDFASGSGSGTKLSLSARFRAFRHRISRQSPEKRRQQLDINPYFWRGSQPWWRNIMSWVIIVAGLTFFIIGQIMSSRSTVDLGGFVFFAWMISAALKLGVCLEAPRILAADKKSGALELVLTTAHTGREVLDGQFQAIRRHFRGPALFMIAAGILALLYEVAMRSNSQAQFYNTGEISTLLVGLLIFVPDLYTCGRLGVARSIASRNELRAGAITFLFVLVLPWVLFAGFMIFVSISRLFFNSSTWNEYNMMLLTWAAIHVAVDVAAWNWAGQTLSRPLQECAGGGNFGQPSHGISGVLPMRTPPAPPPLPSASPSTGAPS